MTDDEAWLAIEKKRVLHVAVYPDGTAAPLCGNRGAMEHYYAPGVDAVPPRVPTCTRCVAESERIARQIAGGAS